MLVFTVFGFIFTAVLLLMLVRLARMQGSTKNSSGGLMLVIAYTALQGAYILE